jgi:hypothetical protein
MAKPSEFERAIYFDATHILSVDYTRQEAWLYENGESGDGRLLFRRNEPAARVSIVDPFQLLNLAVHYAISYELLSQVADENGLKFFEQIGAKAFLERVAAVTTEEDRHNRFLGLGPKFTNLGKESKTLERRGRPSKGTTATNEQATAK